MDLEIRHLLLDLENGRYINNPDEALKFLARAYKQIQEESTDLMPDQLEWESE